VRGERLRRHLQVELDAGARRLRRDRVVVGPQPFHAPDVEFHVLAAGAQDLLVEQAVARVRREVVEDRVRLGQRRQDPDQDDLGVGLAGPLVRVLQRAADLRQVVTEAAASDQPRRHVQLEVELPQLGLESRIRDVREHLGVAHGRIAVRIYQVEFDLQPGGGLLCLEAEIVEHQRENVEATPDLPPVPPPIVAGERGRRDVHAHRPSPPLRGPYVTSGLPHRARDKVDMLLAESRWKGAFSNHPLMKGAHVMTKRDPERVGSGSRSDAIFHTGNSSGS
jgi:hypothetical protein